MKHLLTAIRLYWLVIFLAVVASWIPGIPRVITQPLYLLTWPVWNWFNWAILGNFHLGPLVAMLLLWGLETMVTKLVAAEQQPQAPAPAAPEVPLPDEDQDPKDEQ